MKAAIVYLIQDDRDMENLQESLRGLERYYNHAYRYPIVIFHEGLSEASQEGLRALSTATIRYERLDTFLDLPDYPGLSEAQVARWCAGEDGGRKSRLGYRQMCRFFSYGLYVHPALQEFDYYWRYDSDSYLMGEIPFDPFTFMEERGIIYGYRAVEFENVREIIGLNELWEETKRFARENKLSRRYLKRINANWKGRYTGFNYYNNFEINKVSYWRENALYKQFFKHLDESLGFFKYRWGDANVRALSIGLFLKPHQVHLFNTIPYRHNDHYVLPGTDRIIYSLEELKI